MADGATRWPDRALMSDGAWAPLNEGGAPAGAGATGRWVAEAADLVATDPDGRVALWSADALPCCFPRGWPAVFKESQALKQLINKSMLKGQRCRAVSHSAAPAVAARAAASAAGVSLYPLHSFSNALRLSEALGWTVVKGFLALERADCAPGASFLAIRHWWNATEEGAWVDLTPPLVPHTGDDEERVRCSERPNACSLSSLARACPVACASHAPACLTAAQVLLVESELGDKKAAELTPARRQFAVAFATRLANGAPKPRTPLAPAQATATSEAGAAAVAPKSAGIAPSTEGGSAKAAPAKPPLKGGSLVDYSKWKDLDVSDDEEEEKRAEEKKLAEQKELVAQAAQAAQRQQVEADALTNAIDAAALASAVGNTEVSHAARWPRHSPAGVPALG